MATSRDKSHQRSTSSPTVTAIIAKEVQALRDDCGWTADELARRMRDEGFNRWTRSVVAAVENGGRQVRIDELVGLSLVAGRPITSFVFTVEPWVALGDSSEIASDALLEIFTGQSPADQ